MTGYLVSMPCMGHRTPLWLRYPVLGSCLPGRKWGRGYKAAIPKKSYLLRELPQDLPIEKHHSENVPRRSIPCSLPQSAPEPDLSSLLFQRTLAHCLPFSMKIPWGFHGHTIGISSQDADELWAVLLLLTRIPEVRSPKEPSYLHKIRMEEDNWGSWKTN